MNATMILNFEIFIKPDSTSNSKYEQSGSNFQSLIRFDRCDFSSVCFINMASASHAFFGKKTITQGIPGPVYLYVCKISARCIQQLWRYLRPKLFTTTALSPLYCNRKLADILCGSGMQVQQFNLRYWKCLVC